MASGGFVIKSSYCGHPTLERLVERAESLYGQSVIGMVGGLHYGETSLEKVQPHIQFLQARQPKLIALSPHDSSPQAIATFKETFPGAYQAISVGKSIHYP